MADRALHPLDQRAPQNPRLLGESENAVRTQIWVAVCTYLAVAILRKELCLERSMYEILQILSVSPFEQIGLRELCTRRGPQIASAQSDFSALELGF